MNTRIYNSAYLLALVVFGVFAFSGTVNAYEVEQIPGGDQVFGDFVVGPTKIDVVLEPGTKRVIELLVTNRMGSKRLFSLGVEDMRGSDDVSQPVVLLGDDRGPYSLKDYLKFPTQTFELGHGERARIPVTISIPANAQPGGLYGSVLVTTNSIKGKDDGTKKEGALAGTVIVSRIGALFFVTVPGDAHKEGKVVKFATVPDGKTFFSQGPIGFQILFENTGSVHLNPSGDISIKNILGEEVGAVAIEPWYALPGSTRLRELTWNRSNLFGRYTAEARISRGYNNEMDVVTTSFFVIPWMFLAIGIFGLAVAFFILRFILKTFKIARK